MLASNSAESAEVAELEEETADELAKEVGGKGKGRAQGSPDLDEGRSITLKPSRPTLTQIFTVGPGPLLGTLLHVQKSEAHLLVAVLHAAVPLKQVHGITKLSLFGVVTLLHSQELEAHLLVTALNTAVPLKEVHSNAKSWRHTFWWRRCTLQSLSKRYTAFPSWSAKIWTSMWRGRWMNLSSRMRSSPKDAAASLLADDRASCMVTVFVVLFFFLATLVVLHPELA